MKIIRTNARVESGGGTVHTDILYADLVTLISNNELVPNTSYRITDYTTTTAQTDTQSAGNNFDIIVTALSTNKLSEIASCVRKSGDTYFTNAKLEAWEIKYCINNDVNRFAWADIENGKGVIYYMKDEWNNECPYDFKNIQFKKSGVFLYTFGGSADNSLTRGCHHNTMMLYTVGSVIILNSNTFGIGCYGNTFGNDCFNNTFGNYCHSNSFGAYCFNNTFGTYCQSNSFGAYCYNNTFGNDCKSNTFGINCYSNNFGTNFSYNIFGNWCYSNTFGTGCYSNTSGDGCDYNTFGNGCHSNTFGNSFYNNTFGNNCQYNTFGNNCQYNNFYHGTTGTTKKDYIRYIILEDGCTWNNFYSSPTTSSANYLQRIRIKGLQNTATNPATTQINLSTLNTHYEWVVAKNIAGTVKQYCPENLVP